MTFTKVVGFRTGKRLNRHVIITVGISVIQCDLVFSFMIYTN